jgi:hypothetical protein
MLKAINIKCKDLQGLIMIMVGYFDRLLLLYVFLKG